MSDEVREGDEFAGEVRERADTTRNRTDVAGASGRVPAWVFAVVLPLGASLALLPHEFTYYKRWLELGS